MRVCARSWPFIRWKMSSNMTYTREFTLVYLILTFISVANSLYPRDRYSIKLAVIGGNKCYYERYCDLSHPWLFVWYMQFSYIIWARFNGSAERKRERGVGVECVRSYYHTTGRYTDLHTIGQWPRVAVLAPLRNNDVAKQLHRAIWINIVLIYLIMVLSNEMKAKMTMMLGAWVWKLVGYGLLFIKEKLRDNIKEGGWIILWGRKRLYWLKGKFRSGSFKSDPNDFVIITLYKFRNKYDNF